MYRFADMPAMGNPDLATVALKVPKGVICLISALSWHEMTSEIPHEIYLALPRGAEPPRLAYPPLRIFWFQGDAFEEGVEEHDMDGIRVRIYSPEKTLADCFKYPEQDRPRCRPGGTEALSAAQTVQGGQAHAFCPDMPRGEGHASLSGGDAMTNPRPRNIAASIHLNDQGIAAIIASRPIGSRVRKTRSVRRGPLGFVAWEFFFLITSLGCDNPTLCPAST